MKMNEELNPPKLRLDDEIRLRKIEGILSPLILNMETCQRVRKVFQEEMDRGMQSKPSSLQMANTYVTDLPDGTESGVFIGLDLGGTNFRVVFLEMISGEIHDQEVKYYAIHDDLRLGDGHHLFDYLAECVRDFLVKRQLTVQQVHLGFTFSFPMIQNSLRSGILVTWTKSFNCSGVEGEDVVRLLKEALDRKGCHNVTIEAVLNDTTGTLVAGSFVDGSTTIGLILGTGSNACYLERSEKIQEWVGEPRGDWVVVDVEWGAFGDNGVLKFIQTSYDIEVDRNSLLAGSFTFEKYISGKYLGEIVRVILVDLVKKGLLFDGKLTDTLETSGSLSSSTMSDVNECGLNEAHKVVKFVESLGLRNFSHHDLSVVQYVCTVVYTRSALLVSICLSALLDRIEKPDNTIAVDGSLYCNNPKYQRLVMEYIKMFTKKQFKLIEVKNGSGMGATLLAATMAKGKKCYGD